MKTKTIIAAALLTALFGLGASSVTANASGWHKGTPSALRGKWKTKAHYFYDGTGEDYRTYITKHSIISEMHGLNGGTSDQGNPLVQHCSYKYMGHHLYKFKGISLGTVPSKCLIKWKSHNHIIIKPWAFKKSFVSYYRY